MEYLSPPVATSLVLAHLRTGRLDLVERELGRLTPEQRLTARHRSLWAEFLWQSQRLEDLSGFLRALEETCAEDANAIGLAAFYASRIGAQAGQYEEVLARVQALFDSPLAETIAPSLRARLHIEAGLSYWRVNASERSREHHRAALALLDGLARSDSAWDDVGLLRFSTARDETIGDILSYLGLVERSLDNFQKAEEYLIESLQVYAQLGVTRKELMTLINIAIVRGLLGRPRESEDAALRALKIAERIHDEVHTAIASAVLGLVLLLQRRFVESRAHLLVGYSVSRRLAFSHVRSVAMFWIGELKLRQGELDLARRWLRRAMRYAEQHQQRDVYLSATGSLAEAELQSGRTQRALALAEESRGGFEGLKQNHPLSVSLRVESQVFLALGRHGDAITNLERAQAFFEQIGERYESIRVRRLLAAARNGEGIADVDLIGIPIGPGLTDADAKGAWDRADSSFVADTPLAPAPEPAQPHAADASGDAASGAVANAATRPSASRRTTSVFLDPNLPAILGRSPILAAALERARSAASMDVPVLIYGETGTGKELFARAIHDLGPRRKGRFVAVNCGGGTPEMIDAEFFGHRKGSFTGAGYDRPGLARSADRGTLFLDEVGELPPLLQPRLLRMLDSGEIRPVGSDRTEHVNARIVSATHQDLDRLIETHEFRADLLHRLATVRIFLPPLRERVTDIEILVWHFVGLARHQGRPQFAGVSDEVLDAMAHYSWPGNVRELKNVVFALALETHPGEVARCWVPPAATDRHHDVGPGGGPGRAHRSSHSVPDRCALEAELRLLRGNVTVIAERCGLSRQRVYRLCEKLGLDPKSYR